jgi:hypothetical protein
MTGSDLVGRLWLGPGPSTEAGQVGAFNSPVTNVSSRLSVRSRVMATQFPFR